MIERLSGKLVSRLPTGAVIDVNGVGYGVELPVNLLCQLPENGSDLILWIHTHVREDSLRLFGFSRQFDRYLFGVLLSVSGVGPKVALTIIACLDFATLEQAVAEENASLLQSVPGVGQRLAEKILVDLKPKLKKFMKVYQADLPERAGATVSKSSAAEINEDVLSALENFGFKEREIIPVLKKLATDSTLTFQDLLRNALKELGFQKGLQPSSSGVESKLF